MHRPRITAWPDARLLLFSVVFAALLAFAPRPRAAAGQDARVPTPPITWPEDVGAVIDSVFHGVVAPGAPGAAVLVMRGADIVSARTYGLADVERGVPITPETRFMLASVSKQFTAFGLALLEAEGRLSVDDDVRKFLPELPDYGRRITLRNLVTHTSGLRDSFALLGMAGWRDDDVIRASHIQELAFRQKALNFPPGTAYSYSNTGYVLIAEVIARITGEPFADWMERRVFQPLSMNASRFMDDHTRLIDRRAQGYTPDPAGGFQIAINAYTSVGETGLYTTILDLARWVQNFREPEVGAGAAMNRMNDRAVLVSGDTLDYAFGQSLWTFKGHRAISHSGFHRGFRSYLIRFPATDFAIAVLVNRVDLSPADLGQEMARRIVAPDADSLALYAGAYTSEEVLSTYRLAVEDGVLVARHPRHDPIPLRWEGPDVFTTEAEFFERIAFVREGGRIVRFVGSTGRVRAMPFERGE